MNNDNVNHPSHYTSGPFECIELTSRYPFLGGNAIKYVYRWQDKNGLEDLRKALWYLNRAKAESPLRTHRTLPARLACSTLRSLPNR